MITCFVTAIFIYDHTFYLSFCISEFSSAKLAYNSELDDKLMPQIIKFHM